MPPIPEPPPRGTEFGRPAGGVRARCYDVIFGIDTPAGRAFDVALLRLLRIFRILRLGKFVREFGALGRALAASTRSSCSCSSSCWSCC